MFFKIVYDGIVKIIYIKIGFVIYDFLRDKWLRKCEL